MALSDKVKPHNPKVPVGKVAVVSPVPNRKSGGPTSPRMGPSRPVPVNLTPESTCLGGGALQRKQPSRTGKELCPLKSWGISYVSPSRCVLTLGLHYVFFSNQLQLLIAHSIFKQQLFAENGKWFSFLCINCLWNLARSLIIWSLLNKREEVDIFIFFFVFVWSKKLLGMVYNTKAVKWDRSFAY